MSGEESVPAGSSVSHSERIKTQLPTRAHILQETPDRGSAHPLVSDLEMLRLSHRVSIAPNLKQE